MESAQNDVITLCFYLPELTVIILLMYLAYICLDKLKRYIVVNSLLLPILFLLPHVLPTRNHYNEFRI